MTIASDKEQAMDILLKGWEPVRFEFPSGRRRPFLRNQS